MAQAVVDAGRGRENGGALQAGAAQLPSVPPLTTMSLAFKTGGTSLKRKVMVAVSPTLTADRLLLMLTVGRSCPAQS